MFEAQKDKIRARGTMAGIKQHRILGHEGVGWSRSSAMTSANTAFGGVKASGIGRVGGHRAIDEFTVDHWISVQHQPREYPL
jgi:acyl-CoA reductase-like NAD-dependent aldehyde dehydrogenase